MVQKIYTIQNIKTGKISKITETAYKIAKKHNMDKDWEVIPSMERTQLPPTPTPTPQPVAEEKVIESFMDADDQHTDIEDGEPKKKRKYKTKNNE